MKRIAARYAADGEEGTAIALLASCSEIKDNIITGHHNNRASPVRIKPPAIRCMRARSRRSTMARRAWALSAGKRGGARQRRRACAFCRRMLGLAAPIGMLLTTI